MFSEYRCNLYFPEVKQISLGGSTPPLWPPRRLPDSAAPPALRQPLTLLPPASKACSAPLPPLKQSLAWPAPSHSLPSLPPSASVSLGMEIISRGGSLEPPPDTTEGGDSLRAGARLSYIDYL